MANKYYIAPRTQNPIVTGANMLLKFSEMKNRQGQLDVARERTKIMQQQFDAENAPGPATEGARPNAGFVGPGEGVPGPSRADRRLSNEDKLLEIREQEAARKARVDPVQDQEFGMDMVTMLEAPLKASGMDKAYQPVIDSMKALAQNPKYTKGKVYHHYKSNWPQYQQALIESLNKEATKPGITPAARESLIEQMKEIEGDKTGQIIDKFMPQTAAAISGEQQSSEPFTTWIGQDGKPYNLRRGEQPEPGSIPFKGKGLDIQFDADGRPTRITQGGTGQGGAGAGDISPSVKTKMQTGIVEANDSIDRLGDALETYQPEFNTFPFRAGVKWEKFKQILGMEKDPAAHEQMVAFNGWYKAAMRDYGIAIQQLGKGNLTKNEEQIYGAGLPNPGSELIPKEAPETYMEAVKQRVGGLRAVAARYNYYLNSGFVENEAEYQELVANDRVYSSKEMYSLIDQKGTELEKFYSKSGMEKMEVEAKVSEQLTSLFGVRF